jgi:hypothetical protein
VTLPRFLCFPDPILRIPDSHPKRSSYLHSALPVGPLMKMLDSFETVPGDPRVLALVASLSFQSCNQKLSPKTRRRLLPDVKPANR